MCSKQVTYSYQINEYFIEAGDILLTHMTDLFNIIFDSGYFPDDWADGIIIPLFKKGYEHDLNNFRGITLVSCMSKLFTSILNNRINHWSEKYTKVSDAQFGLREEDFRLWMLFIRCIA